MDTDEQNVAFCWKFVLYIEKHIFHHKLQHTCILQFMQNCKIYADVCSRRVARFAAGTALFVNVSFVTTFDSAWGFL